MQQMFYQVLKMSITGFFGICMVLPVRLLLLKCGRKYAYYLWIIVFVNLLIPFGIYGNFSLIPRQAAELSARLEAQTGNLLPSETSGTAHAPAASHTPAGQVQPAMPSGPDSDSSSPQTADSIPSTETGQTKIGKISGKVPALLWLSGICIIALFNLVHMILLRKQIASDQWVRWDPKRRIAEVSVLPSPFLLGTLSPIIFLPAGLEEEEKNFILLHEDCHRRRGDSYIKLTAFAAVTVHWFNPAVWIAWFLFGRDMEISCDEAALADAPKTARLRYAQTLLRYAAGQNGYFMTPPSFGEPSAKARIANILRFKKHDRLHGLAAALIIVIMALGLTVHPAAMEEMQDLSAHTDRSYRENADAAAQADNTAARQPPAEETEEYARDREGVSTAEISSPARQETLANAAAGAPPAAAHRAGYVDAAITHIPASLYFTPGLRTQEELDALAQKALRELYDLTGFLVESCVYTCSDLGSFFFAKTEDDLAHSRDFYFRSFGEADNYDSLVIPNIGIASARRYWFSDVQQLDIPADIASMTDGALAVWFLQHSCIWQGEEIVSTEPSSELDSTVIATTVDGSFYEITLDLPIQSVSSIYGPYPAGFSH